MVQQFAAGRAAPLAADARCVAAAATSTSARGATTLRRSALRAVACARMRLAAFPRPR